jgi:hypothetical protein
MKRTGIDHPKVKRLASLLGISHSHAVGLCESLWHFTARHAIRGNVGKWANAEIAEGVWWPADDAEQLIEALVEARLVDRHAVHRLVVHDWHDHADESTKKTLKNKSWTFANQDAETESSPESFSTLPEDSGKDEKIQDSLSLSLSLSHSHKPKPKTSCPTLRSDEVDLELASWMWDLIREMQPDRKVPELEKWANTFRLIREQDGRTEADIRELFAWINKDEFWQTNVLSPSKLRAKWDDLKLKRERPNGKNQRNLVGAGQQYDPDAAAKDPDHGVW